MPTFFSEHLILSVEAAKANFCRADLLGLPHSLPRGFELFDIVTVDSLVPLRSVQLVRRKTRVISKSLVDKI
jgi:hypothetical protein